METARTTYLGGLHTESIHIHSGAKIVTDAPLDNHGKGEAFSPTDLFATAYGCCILTTIGIAANAHGFSIDGAEVKTTKVMGTAPRRVVEIILEFTFPANNYSDKERKFIELSAKECPLAFSIHPDIKITKTVFYKE